MVLCRKNIFLCYLKTLRALSVHFLGQIEELNWLSFGTLLFSNRALLRLIFGTEGSCFYGSLQEYSGPLQENFVSNYLEPPSSWDFHFFFLFSSEFWAFSIDALHKAMQLDWSWWKLKILVSGLGVRPIFMFGCRNFLRAIFFENPLCVYLGFLARKTSCSASSK